MNMKVHTFRAGDAVRMQPDTGWRGVVIARHSHRNNGIKVRTTVPHGPMCSDEFWVRPICIALAEEQV